MKINTTVDEATPRQKALNEIARIEGIKDRAVRYQEIHKFMLKLNPELIAYENAFYDQVKEERDSQLKVTGASKAGSTRHLVSIPEYFHTALRVMDPDFYKNDSSKNPEDSKPLYRVIWRAFPKYRIAEKI